MYCALYKFIQFGYSIINWNMPPIYGKTVEIQPDLISSHQRSRTSSTNKTLYVSHQTPQDFIFLDFRSLGDRHIGISEILGHFLKLGKTRLACFGSKRALPT